MKVGKVELRWLGHSSFLLEWGDDEDVTRLYIDPYQIGRARPDAHYILITHSHYDHLSVEDIDSIATPDTQIVATKDCFEKIHDVPGKKHYVKPGDEVEIDGIYITAKPAYNIKKQYHPKEEGWVGYVVELEGKTFYHLGDTDNIPEIKGVECDIAMVPISGTYVMDPKEAAKAVKALKAKKCIPCHWGSFIGTEEDAKEFKKLATGTVTIMNRE